MADGSDARAAEKVVVEFLRQAAAAPAAAPRLGDLASHFFESAGGPRAVAQMLYDEFAAARPGSLIRQRILDLVLKCVRFEHETNPRPTDLAGLSEADLNRELVDVLAECGYAERDANRPS